MHHLLVINMFSTTLISLNGCNHAHKNQYCYCRKCLLVRQLKLKALKLKKNIRKVTYARLLIANVMEFPLYNLTSEY